MSSANALLEPRYSGSHALVIGINKYKKVNPLARAANDAKAVAEILTEKFGFPTANVTLLTDAAATRSAIMQSYFRYADHDNVSPDDRVLIFFAGHGHTVSGRKEVGFLVPVDGDPGDLSTLVGWDDLTRRADLIPAKHMLFLMDACYGGLAVTRKIPPGSSRYLHDMLMRVTRQVVTSGKANETVSDGGGSRPEHSIFTSSLLDALEGAAASSPGVITAMGVMAYVHEKVGKDPGSNQTPHFGFIDGDGDFIFSMPAQEVAEQKHQDMLVKTPQFSATEAEPLTVGGQIKDFIPNPADRIKLDTLVKTQLRHTLEALAPSNFPAQGQQPAELPDVIKERVPQYDRATREIQSVLIQLCRWADESQIQHIEGIFQALGDEPERRAGYTALANLDWYPVLCAIYAGGISAMAANRFDTLKACFLTEIKDVHSGTGQPVIVPAVLTIASSYDSFKALPDMERRYTPRSDHMLSAMQPLLEDELFLGKRYEDVFDKFEIMLALVFADIRGGVTHRTWGPPGRFAWKENSFNASHGPFTRFVDDAKRQGAAWPALKQGFFQGSSARFIEVADGYKDLMGKLNWY
jgi:uncharacterized caspase-like protein